MHVLGAIYFFTLLAVVCNDYFLPSVECICEDLRIPKVIKPNRLDSVDFSNFLFLLFHIKKDVAAATFMAVATTTPEFFTNVIGTFITESDVGLGTIIGSLMFNTLGVAAIASLAASKPVQLDWWPITRDCGLYCANLLLLIVITWDGEITLNETIIMVVLFFVYFIILFQNRRVQPAIKWFLEDYLNCCRVSSYDLPESYIEKNLRNSVITLQPSSEKKAIDDEVEKQVKKPKVLQSSMSVSSISNKTIFMIYNNQKSIDSTEKSSKLRKSLWRLPISNRLKTIWWSYTWPIKFVLTLTVPNPKTYRRLYPLTFLMCIFWIGLNAYMIVWMITVMGKIDAFLWSPITFLMTFLSLQVIHFQFRRPLWD